MADEKPSEATVADVLRDGATALRARGWCRHALVDRGAVCAVGALGVAAGIDVEGYPTSYVMHHVGVPVNALVAFLGLDQGDRFALAYWNDSAARDGEHVAQTFEKAAAAWEEVAGL